MKLRDVMKTTGKHSGILGPLVGRNPSYVAHIAAGRRNMTPAMFVRLYWALRGRLTPEENGLDGADVKLPDLAALPDPDDPGVTWEKDCAPLVDGGGE